MLFISIYMYNTLYYIAKLISFFRLYLLFGLNYYCNKNQYFLNLANLTFIIVNNRAFLSYLVQLFFCIINFLFFFWLSKPTKVIHFWKMEREKWIKNFILPILKLKVKEKIQNSCFFFNLKSRNLIYSTICFLIVFQKCSYSILDLDKIRVLEYFKRSILFTCRFKISLLFFLI